MPIKLKVLVGLLAVSALWNLGEGQWLASLIAAMLAAGVLKGSEGARIAVMVFCGLALLGVVLLGSMSPVPAGLLFYVSAGLPPVLGVWCVTRPDVKRWFTMRV